MPILSDFNLNNASFVIALISAFICLAAFVCSFAVARRDSRHHFEKMVEECLMPISIFIQDSFEMYSYKKYTDTKYIHDGEKILLENLHKLKVFALANGYKYLEEAATINAGTTVENLKSFTYCFLKLEDVYIEFRDQHTSGTIDPLKDANDLDFIRNVNLLMQDYLKLLSKYMFGFKRKYLKFFREKKYHEKLNQLLERSKMYGVKIK